MEITKIIQQYRNDLLLKNYASSSIDNYVSQVTCFLHHFDGEFTDASRINEKSIKEWLLLSKSVNGRKHRISALKLFYKLTIKQPLKFKHIEYPMADKKLPIPLDSSEIQLMVNNCQNLKHKTILVLMYATGIRVSEVINIKFSDIDRSRMIIHIKQAKGRKDRIVPMPESLLKLFERYYREYKPVEYLFNGQHGGKYTTNSIRNWIYELGIKCKINKHIHPHLLRHSHGTNMVEQSVDMSIIQKILGHRSIKTTHLYAGISTKVINSVPSPIDYITI